jgi:prepilin-type processing-associated H-X9-DG protein
LVPDLSGWDEWPLEPDLFVCPMDPDAPHGAPAGAGASDESYFYLGYALPDAAAGRAFLLALQEHAARGEPMRGPVTEGTGADTVTLLPLSVATGGDPPAATIPVMVERTENHQRERPGINVLYLDGHVRFVELGSGFPAEEWFIDGITAVAGG